MSKGYLLDTNIAIAILINEGNVIDFAQQASRDKMPIYFSPIRECEIFPDYNPKNDFVQKSYLQKKCVDVTSDFAKLAGSIRRDQKRTVTYCNNDCDYYCN